MKTYDENWIVGTLQAWGKFGFFIPDHRDDFGGDFYVKKENFWEAVHGDRVKARPLFKTKGKKPEAKVVFVFGKTLVIPEKEQFIEGVFSGGNGEFWFVDVPWRKKGYFVFGDNKNGAQDGDKVKAEVVERKGKKEAIVVAILESDSEIVTGIYKDNQSFGFVSRDDKKWDVFIAGSRKNEAKNGDRVEVKIIKKWGKNPDGIVVRVMGE